MKTFCPYQRLTAKEHLRALVGTFERAYGRRPVLVEVDPDLYLALDAAGLVDFDIFDADDRATFEGIPIGMTFAEAEIALCHMSEPKVDTSDPLSEHYEPLSAANDPLSEFYDPSVEEDTAAGPITSANAADLLRNHIEAFTLTHGRPPSAVFVPDAVYYAMLSTEDFAAIPVMISSGENRDRIYSPVREIPREFFDPLADEYNQAATLGDDGNAEIW